MNILKKVNWIDHLIGLFVVVIGVTIAFSLSNWNENEKLRDKEQKILSSLLSDLKEDSKNLQHWIDTTEYLSHNSSMLLKALHDTTFRKNDSLFYYFLPLYAYTKFSPRDITYNSILFAGEVDVISDYEISKDIISLYQSQYKAIAQLDEEHRVEVFNLKIPYLHSKILVSPNLDPFHPIFKETGFMNYAYGTNYFLRKKLKAYRNAFAECTTLMKQIENKLAKK